LRKAKLLDDYVKTKLQTEVSLEDEALEYITPTMNTENQANQLRLSTNDKDIPNLDLERLIRKQGHVAKRNERKWHYVVYQRRICPRT